MQESINKITEFAKTRMNIKEINACIYVENIKSINLVEKLNFIENGSKNELFRGKEYNHHIYTLFFDK
jgi:ribosomal-protein-alanine N-acetyltransferase